MIATYAPEDLRKAFWKEDLEHGGIIHSQYEEIKRVLDQKDMAWVQTQYRKLRQHAIAQTDFYSKYGVDDVFSVVNKSILLENYEACKAKAGFSGPTHMSSTSGSTGTSFTVIQDYRKRKRTIADLKVFGERCDYPSHERMIFFRVLSENLRRTPEQEDRENIYYIDSSNLDEEHLHQMYEAILVKQPRIIFSYASTLVELARYISNAAHVVEVSALRSVLTAGEGISEQDRRLLEKVFHCSVYRRYSDMELGILGQDTGNGSAYFLNYGSYYFECLKIDSDAPAAPGEVGRIVITDLFNYAFPMIRYDTGDLGIMDVESEDEFPVLREIYGRIRDCVYATDGALISPAKISVMMWQAKGVRQWQFIQQSRKEYLLKINSAEDVDRKYLKERFQNLIGADAVIRIEQVEEIPVLSSNKRRAVVCNYQKPAYKIYQVTQSDQKAAALRSCDHAFSNPVTQRNNYESLFAKIDSSAEFLAAYRQQEVLGYIALYANDLAGKTAYVTLLAVRPEAQNMHIGSALMKAAMELAAERGMERIRLEVSLNNEKAIRIYEKAGFVKEEETGKGSVYMVCSLQ